MGATAGVIAGNINDWGQEEERINLEPEEPKDPRRRNSLAFNIATYVRLDPLDQAYDPVVNAIKEEQNKVQYRVRAATVKYTKIAESILHGSMKECRDQCLQSFRTINRKFRDQFLNQSLIHFICQEGYVQMLKFIIDPKNHSVFEEEELLFNPRDIKGRTPLYLCFTPPTATFLGIKYGINEDGLPRAVRPAGINNVNDWIKPAKPADREQCIKILIDHGAEVNIPDYHKFYPLHYAAMWGWEMTARRVLTAGAELNPTNINGRTPLHFAVEYGHYLFVEFLMTKLPQLHINSPDAEGNTALLLAILGGTKCLKILRLLLENKADPECLNSKKLSALHIACETQNLEQINILFDFKVDRKEYCLNLLQGNILDAIKLRIEEENKQELLEIERLAKENILRERDGMVDLRYQDPTGQWVLLNDKRGTGVFYYNKISRISTRKQPIDYIPDLTKPVQDVTFGMHYYRVI